MENQSILAVIITIFGNISDYFKPSLGIILCWISESLLAF